MMIEEFEKRTGFYPTQAQYAAIERAYMEFDGDKDAFCKAYKKNADGMAEAIARKVSIKQIVDADKAAKETAKRISDLEAEVERLQAALEREQEWKPYEDTHNITQAQYTELAESVPSGAAHYMTDNEALDWICDEFGFERNKVTILHEVDEYEINRHRHLRKTGKKIDRRPIYCATDYHYIRFSVGRGQWQWECWNGQLRPFYD